MYSASSRLGCGEACDDWLKLATQRRKLCHKLGNETVNGRTRQVRRQNSKGGPARCGSIQIERLPVKGRDPRQRRVAQIQEGASPSCLLFPRHTRGIGVRILARTLISKHRQLTLRNAATYFLRKTLAVGGRNANFCGNRGR